jgi:phosphoglycolate phosphatase-like HAD superfamily hydrolase
MPKAILFDLDGTLWDRTTAVKALLADQHEHFQVSLGPVIPPHEYVSEIMALEANGSADKFSVYVAFGEQCGLSESLIDSLHSDFWRRMGRCFQPFPEVLATLRRLRKAGVKLGIITNGTVHIQDAKINALGLRDLMDVIAISEREGVRKPTRRFSIVPSAVSASQRVMLGLWAIIQTQTSPERTLRDCERSGVNATIGPHRPFLARRFGHWMNCSRCCPKRPISPIDFHWIRLLAPPTEPNCCEGSNDSLSAVTERLCHNLGSTGGNSR